MKKRILTVITGILAMTLLVGCGQISDSEITIKKYKGLVVDKIEASKVTDEDVENSIKSDLQTLAEEIDIKDRAAQLGDRVVIDFVGKMNGETFEGGSDDDYTLELGSHTFIDGFEEGIVGHKIGETFDLNLTFPKDYHEELAGKDVVFTVTLDSITEIKLPELTDEVVKQLSQTATTVEEYKKTVKKDLEKSNAETAKQSLEEAVWTALLDNCKVKKFPEKKLKEEIENIEKRYGSYASYYGMETAEFIQTYLGDTSEGMAKKIITQEYAVELIAKKEKLTLSAKEYDKKLKEYAELYSYDDVSEFEKLYGEETLKKVFLQGKVADFLMDNCVQKAKSKSK